MESAFMYNPGLTQLNIGILRESNYFFAWKLKYLKYEIYIDNEDWNIKNWSLEALKSKF